MKVLMPISETGTSIRPKKMNQESSGFSLLELLVVITIIGLIAGTAVLSVGVLGGNQDTQGEALRLQAILKLLQEDALMQSRDYGIVFSSTSYQFYIYDHQLRSWLETKNETFLLKHELRPPLRISLAMDGQDLILSESISENMHYLGEPHVLILSSGEMTPFKLGLSQLANDHLLLTGKLDGTVDIFSDESL